MLTATIFVPFSRSFSKRLNDTVRFMDSVRSVQIVAVAMATDDTSDLPKGVELIQVDKLGQSVELGLQVKGELSVYVLNGGTTPIAWHLASRAKNQELADRLGEKVGHPPEQQFVVLDVQPDGVSVLQDWRWQDFGAI